MGNEFIDNLRPAKSDSPLNRRVRAFLGIGPAPEDWAEALGLWVTQMSRPLERFKNPIKWTPAENLHVTLRFFGSISQEEVLTISERVKKSAAETKRFTLDFAGLTVFPTLKRPRVCAVTMREAGEELDKLEARIRAETREFGQPPENRPFHPHVTYGRLREEDWPMAIGRQGEIVRAHFWIPGLSSAGGRPELPAWRVEKVTLFKSATQGSGPVYSPLAVFPLGSKVPE